MEPVIKVENLGKNYVISHQSKMGESAFRDELSHKLKGILSGKPIRTKKTNEEFWALKNVSFEINKGERVGIIGRNGAGKSTLLKILSQITEPTTGKITIEGRVSSLLEVGTGFHPELTGRENIFLNGAIIGMSKREIESKFNEIVAFAEIERFLDTPVKHYSSGMYVRLAFSVSAHVDPDVMIVDEALSVGDAAFQKKCLDKMEAASKQGKTILVVSHNMSTVLKLCSKAILLRSGEMEAWGNAEEVINSYYHSNFGTSSRKSWVKEQNKDEEEIVRLLETSAHNKDFKTEENYDITKPIGISMDYEVLKDGEMFTHSFNIYNADGVHLFSSHDVKFEAKSKPSEKGVYTSTMWVPGNLLAEGNHTVSVAIIRITPFYIFFHEMDAIRFTVIDNMKGDSARGNYLHDFPGVVRPLLEWQTAKK
jgi:lipopolysaccharide transport system ATP-binding protein